MNLISIFMTLHPDAEEYTFWSAHGTFSRIDHILCHKPNLNKFKKIEIASSIFSNHNAETRYQLQERKKKTVRNIKTRRLNNTFVNNQQVTEETKRAIKKFIETNDNENSKSIGCSKSSSKRKVYSYTILPQETRKTSNKQPNFTPKTTGKRKNNQN